jgi:spermidine synthase
LWHVDAREYLAKSNDKYDAIIIDLTEPIEEGPAYLLYTREFYQMVNDRLTSNGFIAVQAGCASLIELLNFTAVYNTLKSVFKIVLPYQADIPSFGGPWGFCLASQGGTRLAADEIDKTISARGLKLRFYDGRTHQGMFALSKPLREALDSQTLLITDEQPLYIYGQGRQK